ncbi:hypothetical protein ASG23_01770 [Cellulomonas sp. Leaf395]|nr:hypothetical protein ASG23_01770 [Cellulomonas sp. Leaf395]
MQHAQRMRIVRADGYEAEDAMPYAALQRIGTSFRDHLPEIPDRQVAALRIAAGLDSGPPPDRFLVGLGMLSLFAAAGESEPIVCVVDDAHLLDAESLEVLAFVARRLKAESLALILATRPDERLERVTAGVARLELSGLDALSAVHLLNQFAAEPLDPYVAAQIARESVGNPLSLIDLGREVSARELTTSTLTPDPVPVGTRLEAHYRREVDALPRSARQWLRVAAVESSGDAVLIGEAAERLGLAVDAAEGAERFAAGRDTVRFRHPLVRSAVYNGMPSTERRRLHGVLRDVADENGHADVAVWHAAAAVVGTDESVAARMVQAADKTGGRGGTASRARLLARAADLTPDGPSRDGRLIEAAEAAASAGAAQLALEFLDRVDPTQIDPVSQGRVLSLRTLLALFVGDPDGVAGATATLLQAADLFHGIVPELEEHTLLRAFELALTAEWAMTGATLPELGQRLQDGAGSVLRRALAAHILSPYAESAPQIRAALQVLRDAPADELLAHVSLGVSLSIALWDERACIELLERMARAAREAGALRALDTALWVLSLAELVRGDALAAGRYVEQVRDLRQAIGYDAEQVVNASYLAWSGAPKAQVEAIAEATRTSGFGGAWTMAMTGLGIREIAEGHYRDAFDRFRPMVEQPFLQVTYQQLPEYIEAGVRSGHVEAVQDSAERLAMMAAVSGTPWVRGVSDRCAALLARDDAAEDLYRSAIKHLQESTALGDHGRAHLLYGEWLRRQRRRRQARDELRTALGIFERAGAAAFADRARRELEATGERVSHEAPSSGDGLTPQESAVAHLAAEGQTNAEIAAALFISAHTVDYHLRKVFRKLEVTSRRQLGERFVTP